MDVPTNVFIFIAMLDSINNLTSLRLITHRLPSFNYDYLAILTRLRDIPSVNSNELLGKMPFRIEQDRDIPSVGNRSEHTVAELKSRLTSFDELANRRQLLFEFQLYGAHRLIPHVSRAKTGANR